jgi:biotin synthase
MTSIQTTALPLDPRIGDILSGALAGQAPGRDELIALLSCHEASLEAACTRAVADVASRKKFRNQGMLLGQIGIETFPCPANCRFCVFGEGHTSFPETRLSEEEVVERSLALARDGDLYALFLMTMHEFEMDRLLSIVEKVQASIADRTQIVVNIGDFDRSQAEGLKAAGVNGAYHVCRLREGTDTDLDGEDRKRTFQIIREAELDFYYCCEPVGPEHTPEELVDQLLLGVEFGCFQHAAMRRVYVPGSPLAHHGQISELRLAQVVAAVALASLECPRTDNIAVHEPNLIGLTSGANVVYAETGANPRDTAEDTSGHRGLDMPAARKMLYESGFTALRIGDDTQIPLTVETLTGMAAD